MAKLQTSILIETLSGKAGQVVFTQTRRGTQARTRVMPRQPNTPKQVQTRTALIQTANAWKALTTPEFEAWKAYAATLTNSESRITNNAPIPYNAFTALSTKLLQIDPATTLPTFPPTSPLIAETVKPQLITAPTTLTLSTHTFNTAGHTTEILLQPLANAHRIPIEKHYRTAAFKTFTSAARTLTLPLNPGAYAVAVRIVNQSTGQQSSVTSLGIVTI